MEEICTIKTRAKTLKGVTRAIYNDDPLWYEGCDTEAERVESTKKWLGDGLEWEKGKGVTIYCL